MPDASFNQPNFLGGEWSPNYQGRADNPRYKTAMNVCLNGLPIEEGAWTRRGGTKFMGLTRAGSPARILPFNYSYTLPYMLEFTDSHLRIWNGDTLVLDSTETQTVTNISAASPAVITVTPAATWATGDVITFAMVTAGTPPALGGLINRQVKVTKITTTTFSLTDAADGTNVDGTVDGNVWDGTTSINAYKVIDFTTPYTATQSWYDNRIVQFNQIALVLNVGYAPQVLAVTAANANQGQFSVFSWGALSFIDGPYFAPGINQTLAVSGTSGTITCTLTNGFGPNQVNAVAGDVGRLVRIFSEPDAWASGTAYTSGNIVKYNNAYYTASASSTGSNPDTNPSKWTANPSAVSWVWGTIATVASGTSITVALNNGPLPYSGGNYVWRLGLFGGQEGYPRCGCAHEGRIWMAKGNTIVSSVPTEVYTSNITLDMTPTLQDGTVTDASAINYTLESGTEDANDIQWMRSDMQGIVAGSFAGEWVIQAATASDPITATSIQAKQISKYGAANVEPVKTGIVLVFVQKFRRRVLELIADVFTGRYRAPDLAIAARHLTLGQVEELAYQEEITPIIWSRTRDGGLNGTTYRRTSTYSTEEPNFVGWHRHQLGSNRSPISLIITSVPLQSPG